MRLGEYLAAPRPPWDWVSLDCCRWIDGWVVARGRDSAIRALDLRYNTERSALRTIVRGGGLVALWTAGMARIGVLEVDIPAAGDVAVIERSTVCGLDQAMAIFTGERWASLGLRGIEVGPADALRVWRP